MIKRVHQVSTEAGKTHFSDGEIELSAVEGVSPGGVFHAGGLGEGEVALVFFEAGFSCGFHHTPAPTWMCIMSGEMEIEVSDGESRVLSAGDVVRFTDSDGQGHRSAVIGDQDVIVATAGFSA